MLNIPLLNLNIINNLLMKEGLKMSEEILRQILVELRKKNDKKISVKDWIIISTVIIGAILTVFALIWQAKPTGGIIMVSFLLFISFPFFVNSVSANSKVNFYTRSGEEEVSKKHVERLMTFAEISFGGGFTIVISALSILGYEYLKDFSSGHIISLLFPTVFLATVWIICVIYTYVDHQKFKETPNPTKQEVLSRENEEDEITEQAKSKITKRTVYILVEIVFLVFIILDYFGIFLIQ